MGITCSSVDTEAHDRPYYVPKRGNNIIQPEEESMEPVTDSCINISLVQEKNEVMISLSGVTYYPSNHDNQELFFINSPVVILKIVTTVNDGETLCGDNVIVRRPSINWGNFDVAQQVPEQLPSRLPPGTTTVYGILSEGSALSSEVFLEGVLVEEEVEFGTFVSEKNFASDEDVIIMSKQIKDWESAGRWMVKIQNTMVKKEFKDSKENHLNKIRQETSFAEMPSKTNISALSSRFNSPKKTVRGSLTNTPTASPQKFGTPGRAFSNNSLVFSSCEIPITKSSYSYNIGGSSLPDKFLFHSPRKHNRRDTPVGIQLGTSPVELQFGSPPACPVVHSSKWWSANSLLDDDQNQDDNIPTPSSLTKSRDKDILDVHRQQYAAFLNSSMQKSPSHSSFGIDRFGNSRLICDPMLPRRRANTFSENISDKKVTFEDSVAKGRRATSTVANFKNMKDNALGESLLNRKLPKGTPVHSTSCLDRDLPDADAPFRQRANTFSGNLGDKKVTFDESTQPRSQEFSFVANRCNVKSNTSNENLMDGTPQTGTPVRSILVSERPTFNEDTPFRQRAHTFSENLNDKKVKFNESSEQRSRASSFGTKSRNNSRVPSHVRQAILNQLSNSKPPDEVVSSKKVEYKCCTSKGVTEISRITTSVGISKVVDINGKPRQFRRCNTMPSSLAILQSLI